MIIKEIKNINWDFYYLFVFNYIMTTVPILNEISKVIYLNYSIIDGKEEYIKDRA